MKSKKKKWLIVVLAILLTGAISLIIVRGLSNEDSWTCKDGSWQKHGNPSAETPQALCPID